MGTQEAYKLVWSETLSVGIPEIDAEHRDFIGAINELNAALAARAPREELNRIMARLIEDAHSHFGHEQRLFRQYRYPEARRHALLHEEIRKRLASISWQFNHAEFDREWITLGLEIKQTLVSHLLEEDMKYKGFLSDASNQPVNRSKAAP